MFFGVHFYFYLLIHLSVYFYSVYVCICVCVCVCRCVHIMAHYCGGQRTTCGGWFLCHLGSEDRIQVIILAASSFIPCAILQALICFYIYSMFMSAFSFLVAVLLLQFASSSVRSDKD